MTKRQKEIRERRAKEAAARQKEQTPTAFNSLELKLTCLFKKRIGEVAIKATKNLKKQTHIGPMASNPNRLPINPAPQKNAAKNAQQ